MNQVQSLRPFLKQFSHHVTHLAVAHTPFHPYAANDKQLERMSEQARKQCRFFLRTFSQKLYGAKAHRKPSLYQPLMLTTIEGTRKIYDPALTIHYNFAIGHLPSGLTMQELTSVFRECWVDKAGMSGDKLWIEQAQMERVDGWINYTTKEAEQGNFETWDFENTRIPYLALAAD